MLNLSVIMQIFILLYIIVGERTGFQDCCSGFLQPDAEAVLQMYDNAGEKVRGELLSMPLPWDVPGQIA